MENTMVSDTDIFENFLLETGTEEPILVVEATDAVDEIGNFICRNNDG